MTTSEFIEPADRRWTQTLGNTRHDFYHLPEYLSFSAKHEGGEPRAFYFDDGVSQLLAPLLIRELPHGLDAPPDWRDAITPYGYPSPIMTGSGDADFLSKALDALRTECAEQSIVSTFFRMHPLIPMPAEAMSHSGSLIRTGETVYIDLSKSTEEIWSQTRRDHRAGIEKLRRSHFYVTMDDWTSYESFIEMYLRTMDRVAANDYYSFSHDYFMDLKEALGDNLHLFTVLSAEDDIAAAGLFPSIDGIVQYHLSGTSDRFLKSAPTKLMLDHVRNWAKQEGFDFLHLGGGLGAGHDSLFKFKAGFSKSTAAFFTYRMIVDGKKYETLSSGIHAPDDFFPAYRRLGG